MSNLYDGRVLIINGNFRIVKDTYGTVSYTHLSFNRPSCSSAAENVPSDKETWLAEMTGTCFSSSVKKLK